MKICFIGASGHSSAVARSGRLAAVTPAGIAAGSKGESIDNMYKYLCGAGHSPEKYDDYIKMLDELRPDAVIVDNYYGDHAAASIEALKRGAHVLADKPLATTLDDLDKLKKEQAKSGRQIAAMFTMRFETEFRAAHQIVKSGQIGDVRIINAQKSYRLGARPDFYKSRKSFGGLIPWVGIHAIDLIYLMTGKQFAYIDASCSSQSNANHGDLDVTAAANFILEGDILATVTIDYLRPSAAPSHGDDRLRVVGSSGIVEVLKNKVTLIDKEGERELALTADSHHTHTDMFADFLDYIDGRESLLNTEEAFYITETAIRAQISADEKRA